eukprot:684967-Prymnesium_polylepis.1
MRSDLASCLRFSAAHGAQRIPGTAAARLPYLGAQPLACPRFLGARCTTHPAHRGCQIALGAQPLASGRTVGTCRLPVLQGRVNSLQGRRIWDSRGVG